MARPSIDLKAKILDCLEHVGDMPDEANSPLAHYKYGTNATMAMRSYMLRPLSKLTHRPSVRDRHFHVLDNMMIVNLVQSFERFIKDLAAVCVDHLCDRVMDNRFDKLTIKGGFFAAHFTPDSTAGKALCESSTWLNCDDINEQFKRFLRDPANPNQAFQMFPPQSDEHRFVSIIWQLRHTIVHNVGVITRSDAAKLQVLARKSLESPKVLLPEWDDVRFIRSYLDERAEDINQRVGAQLAHVLTSLIGTNPTLFVAQDEADALSAKFGTALTIGTAVGVLPP